MQRLDVLIENEMRQNDILDRKIQNLNLNIQEQALTKDMLFVEKDQERRNQRWNPETEEFPEPKS